MLLFGHTGIVAGVAKACEILGSVSRPPDIYQPDAGSRFAQTIRKKRFFRPLNSPKNRTGSIDYRLVLLGSLLPDILDKPLWFLSSGDIFASGYDYGHTFLLSLALLICGLILLRYRKSWLLIISSGSFIHLICDQMWNTPVTLWWPLLGPFLRLETTGWVLNIWQALFSRPSVYIPEIIGLIALLLLGYRLLVSKSIIKFIRTGAID